MMRDYDRILHILGAIDDALESTDGITKETFLDSKDKRAAAERYVMIVGEAAHMVSMDMKQAHPEVEWDRITGLRNMIAHEYMRVDYSGIVGNGAGNVAQEEGTTCRHTSDIAATITQYQIANRK